MLKLFTFVQIAADSLRKREEGQTMAEYGVVLAVITLAVVGAITLLSDNVRARSRTSPEFCPASNPQFLRKGAPSREGAHPLPERQKELP